MNLRTSGSSRKSARHVRTFPFWTRRLTVLFGIGALACLPARGQLMDSLALFSRQTPRITAKLDSRGSFIRNSHVRLMGIKVGLEHAGRFQYGLGYTFLVHPAEFLRTVDGVPEVPVRLRMGYATPYVEYAFFQRGPWEVRIPVQFGLGRVSLLAGNGRDKRVVERSFLLTYEPCMTVQYRFLRYFGASAGWGFRLVLAHTHLDEPLTAPIYLLGVKVFFGDLMRDLER